jgi:hypothetical protein
MDTNKNENHNYLILCYLFSTWYIADTLFTLCQTTIRNSLWQYIYLNGLTFIIHVHVLHFLSSVSHSWSQVDSERVRYMYMYYIIYRLYLIVDGGQWKSEIHVHVLHFLSFVSHSWWWTVKERDPPSAMRYRR